MNTAVKQKQPVLTITKTVKVTDTGDDAKLVQEWLTLHGFKVAIDGIFGPATKQAVESFQSANNLKVTGSVDKNTFEVLVRPIKYATKAVFSGNKLNLLLVQYAKLHLSQHPREVGGQNCGPWVRLYMKGNEGNSFPWCAGFVSYLLARAADSLTPKATIPIKHTFSCDVIANEAKNSSLFIPGASAKPQDIEGGIFLVKGKTAGDWIHTGIVQGATKDYVRTIEGNTNDDGAREGYEVCERIRAYKNLDFVKIAG